MNRPRPKPHYAVGKQGEWNPFAKDDVMPAKDFGPWVAEKLNRDPPSLSLKQNSKSRKLQDTSTGLMHQGHRRHCLRCEVDKNVEYIHVRKEDLKSCFHEILEGVRYPPRKLEFSW